MSITEAGKVGRVEEQLAEKPLLPSKESTVGKTPYMAGVGTEMVDIYVGPAKVLFRLYKSKVCAKIPYFDKMFNGNFNEASSNVAHLPEDEPEAFDLLAEWANHPMPTKSSRRIRDLVTVKDENGEEMDSWDAVGFYGLTEKFCLPELQDIIMDMLIRYHKKKNELPSVDFTRRALEGTPGWSPLKDYCTRAMLYVMEEGLEDTWKIEDVTGLFQIPGFTKKYLTLQCEEGGRDPRQLGKCDFHAHKDGLPCAAVPNNKKRIAPESEKADQVKRLRVETPESVERYELVGFRILGRPQCSLGHGPPRARVSHPPKGGHDADRRGAFQFKKLSVLCG